MYPATYGRAAARRQSARPPSLSGHRDAAASPGRVDPSAFARGREPGSRPAAPVELTGRSYAARAVAGAASRRPIASRGMPWRLGAFPTGSALSLVVALGLGLTLLHAHTQGSRSLAATAATAWVRPKMVGPAPSPIRTMARSGVATSRPAVVNLVDSADDALVLTAFAPPDVDIDAMVVTSTEMATQVRQVVVEADLHRWQLGQPPIRLIDLRCRAGPSCDPPRD